MALIKLRKASEGGDEIGPVFVNTDQIVSVSAGAKTTEITLANGGTQWVKETPDEVAAKAKAGS